MTGRFDGGHLFGRTGVRDYTNSVKSILVMAMGLDRPKFVNEEEDNHTNCEQARYQRRQSVRGGQSVSTGRSYADIVRKNTGYVYSVPTKNFYNPLN